MGCRGAKSFLEYSRRGRASLLLQLGESLAEKGIAPSMQLLARWLLLLAAERVSTAAEEEKGDTQEK
jgi:hypothetical protein